MVLLLKTNTNTNTNAKMIFVLTRLAQLSSAYSVQYNTMLYSVQYNTMLYNNFAKLGSYK
jgi:hypothetical protein